MKSILSKLKGDRGIWLVIVLLSLISTLAVYSSSSSLAFRFQGGNTEFYLIKHVLLIALGFGVMYVTHQLDYRFFARISLVLLGLSVLLLGYVLVFGQRDEINGASRWISVFGQSFQPSDLAKFSLIIYLARLLTDNQADIKDFYRGFLPGISWVLIICGLIAPSNLSTAMLLFGVSLILMLIAGVSLRHIGGLVLIGIMGMVILFATAKRAETWKNRLKDYSASWTEPEFEPSYQVKQAYIAIASGGVFGQGAGKSAQRHYLPESYSDFVYAIILEEYGLIGGLVVLALYLVLLFRSVAIVTLSKTFGALLAAGLSFLIVIQALINMGVTVGLLPVTGLPLPVVSMGGTSMLFTGMSLGVILSVSRAAIADQLAAPTIADVAPEPAL
jgi:cell division protein FtsW